MVYLENMEQSIRIPIRLESSANKAEHHFTRYKRNKRQSSAVALSIKTQLSQEPQIPCTIRLTRVAPRSLDYDNLVYSFKSIRDVISAVILNDYRPGRADSDPRIQWTYGQKKGNVKEYAVEISILPSSADVPL